MAITREQRLALESRVDLAERRAFTRFRPHARNRMPAELRKAQRRIDAWKKAQERIASARNEKVAKASNSAREKILFGTDAEALRVVKKFEATKF